MNSTAATRRDAFRIVLTLVWMAVPGFASQVFATQNRIPNTQTLDIPFTTPAEALAAMKLPPGFQATLFAAEPDVHQPVAVTTDHRGRLWVVECYTYSDGKQNYDVNLNDRIVIFEDQNHDGVFDKRTVFWDQGKKLTGIEVGLGGVWVTAAPRFMFIPDRNHDDQPDGAPEVMLDGFEDDLIRHNIVNGLRWGPDGWLYGRHGIQATSLVGPPGATESQRTPVNCAIWRFHPMAHQFEIVAEGGTNPWGFDYDDHGEMFMINTVIGHLFHVVPGARFRRMYGSHTNPSTYQVIEQTADHFHWDVDAEHWAATKKAGLSDGTDAAGGGHAHTGLMVYLGDNWPDEYRNRLLTSNFHGRRINVDTIHRAGNSYVGRHGTDFMKTSDPWFRGIETVYGNDGGVYLLDWSDIGECHENDGIHRTSGRIFKITYGTPDPPAHEDMSRLENSELVACLSKQNDWYVRQARRLLQERALKSETAQTEIVSLLKRNFSDRFNLASQSAREKLRYMWALYSARGADEAWLRERLKDENENVRAWAIRLLADGLTPISPSATGDLIELAKSDPSGLVRLYLASSLARLSNNDRFMVADALCRHATDAADRVQPHLIWFGIEPVLLSNSAQSIAIAKTSRIPLVRENIVRRFTEQIDTNPAVQQIADWLAEESDPNKKIDILRGMTAALDGWAQAPAPENWEQTSKLLAASDPPELAQLAQQLDVVFGNGRAMDELKSIASDQQADLTARRKAIQLISSKIPPAELFRILKPLINDKSLATQVTEAMVHCEDPKTAEVILNRFAYLRPEGKYAAINTLVSRQPWAMQLLDAVNDNRVPKHFIFAWHARQMNNFGDTKLSARLSEVWGEIRESSAQKRQQMTTVSKLISQPGEPKLENGKALYEKHCASCHTLYGAGGKIGPDLTGSNRKNLNYLLENIIDPSATVAESYRSSIFQLEDGRLLTGVVVERNERVIKLQTKDELIALDAHSIEDSRKTERSLMPDGLLEPLSEQDTIDLFAYLMGRAGN